MELPADDDGPTIQVKPGSMRMVHQASFESAGGASLQTPARKPPAPANARPSVPSHPISPLFESNNYVNPSSWFVFW